MISLSEKEQENYKLKLGSMSNEEVYNEYVDKFQNDEEDGYCSENNCWLFERVHEEFLLRLSEVDYFKDR